MDNHPILCITFVLQSAAAFVNVMLSVVKLCVIMPVYIILQGIAMLMYVV